MEKSTDSDACIIHAPIQRDGKSETQPQKISTDSPTIGQQDRTLYSDDYDDPKIGDVLQRHMKECVVCQSGLQNSPLPFGVKDTHHCSEYWEIVKEYSDYERDYVSKGEA